MDVGAVGRQDGGTKVRGQPLVCNSQRSAKKNELKPWKTKEWVIPPEQNSAFVAQMEQVLDVYKEPYDADFPVVCMYESPKQLIEVRNGTLAMKPGKEKRQDCDYIRQGMVNIFMAGEPLKGKRYVEVHETKTKRDWALFVEKIIDQYPTATKIRLVLDNLRTHSPAALYESFPPAKAKALWNRLEFIYTPVHGSWLNITEIELHVLNGQCLNRPLDSIEKVKQEVEAWQKDRNNKNNKINWQFTTQNARIKLKRLYPTFDA